MDLSLVIPVKEESENLPELLKEIVAAIGPTGFSYEVIIIDDGSRDNTWDVVENLSKEYPFIRGFRFQFNCGKADALALGFSKAKGNYVATLDGDLQDDPLEIPKMIKILDEGYDLVSGWKIRRLDPWHKTWPSKLFNLTVSMVCGKRTAVPWCAISSFTAITIALFLSWPNGRDFALPKCPWPTGPASMGCPSTVYPAWCPDFLT